MHSCETLPAPPATGPNLLLQLGRLIIRARSASPVPRAPAPPRDRLLQAKLLAANPSTSQQVVTQPKPDKDEPRPGVEASLNDHVHALWNDQIPICIEVLLAPDCPECYQAISRVEEDSSYDKQHSQQRALLLERWSMRALVTKSHESPAFITSQWLLNAVRSQLHFSQLAAWLARLKGTGKSEEPGERRRKLSREKCNYKKLESNCDEETDEQRKLNIVYSIKIPGESYKMAEFSKPPTDHTFPITDIGNNVYLKVTLQSLPRIDEVPNVKCTCPPKRRASKEVPVNLHEELVGKLNDLTIGPRGSKFSPDLDVINSNTGPSSRRLSIISTPASTEYLYSVAPEKKVVDDRMHTTCSESGKHKCECDESDGNHRSSTSLSQEPKKLDERRLKEIAKYKRRLRKESKLKLCDSTSSEGDGLGQKSKETHTSIPILQAARFDRFRAIGCYRNQTYLTLPASRMETRSPFVETDSIPPAEFKKTNTVATQTDELTCACGSPLVDKCESCIDRGMVRSEANYNLASIDQSEVLLDAINRCKDENGARRKCEEDNKSLKKHKCDNYNIKCDISSIDDSFNLNGANTCPDEVIKRPKLRRIFPIVDKIEKIVSERAQNQDNKDMEELHLKDDDTVFSKPKESKRQKTFSINDDDYVFYEKCDYGTFDRCEVDSPSETPEQNGFVYPDPRNGVDNQVPSPSEMDRFRWRFDSAASMVFHTKTGLPLTSSPAPLRRGNNCFDFDDSINGISGIKSALFHPIPRSPPAPCPSPCPSPRPAPPPPPPRAPPAPRPRMGPSAGLLGSFEESALKGRLEPVATVHGFTAELGASGAFCPPHKRLPVTVFFYAPGGTNAPYMGHINLGPSGYRVARSGTIQVSLFNPHGTLVKMFVVLYDLTGMPAMARTFLRQRTLYMPAGAAAPAPHHVHKWLRYLIHLRFMTSKSGKLYLHTDIRIIVSRKADLDTATAHSAIFRSIPNNKPANEKPEISTNEKPALASTNGKDEISTNESAPVSIRTPNRVFGGCSEFDSEIRNEIRELGYENQNGVSYELRSFTYAPENPRFSPR